LANVELSNADESRLAVEEKVTTLESDLITMRKTVDDEARRVAQLRAELAVAEAEHASAHAARGQGEATLQATKEELDLIAQ
jgi:septal ring factor EnvC (AmiA/AmiB activator)